MQVGQSLELDLPGWTLSTRPPDVLQQVAVPKAIAGRTIFATNRSGSQRITSVLVPIVSCPIECNPPAPQYGQIVVVVVPAGLSFDAALSEMDNGRTFLLTSGQRVIAAIPFATLIDSDPRVVLPGKVGNDASLSDFTAQKPGQVQLSGTGDFTVTLLVKPATSPYDVVASESDGGKTIPAKVGQVIVFRLKNSAGFLPWRGGSGALNSVVDPAAWKDPDATTFTYLVRSPGTVLIRFEDDPSCWDKPTCADIGRILNVSLEVGP